MLQYTDRNPAHAVPDSLVFIFILSIIFIGVSCESILHFFLLSTSLLDDAAMEQHVYFIVVNAANRTIAF